MSSPTRTGFAAIAWARGQITSPNKNYRQLCLQFTRMCYGVVALHPSARVAWANARYRNPTTDPMSIPAGVPVYWKTSSQYDHVAISTGDGRCVSTDILRSGKPDEVTISTITRGWSAPLLGWAEDINGVRVYGAPLAPTPTPTVPEEDIMASIADLKKAIEDTLTGAKLVPVGDTKWTITHVLDSLRRLTSEMGPRAEDAVLTALQEARIVPVGDQHWTVTHVLDSLRRTIMETRARQAGLEAMVRALAEKEDADLEGIYETAYNGAFAGGSAAIDDKIDNATITLETK